MMLGKLVAEGHLVEPGAVHAVPDPLPDDLRRVDEIFQNLLVHLHMQPLALFSRSSLLFSSEFPPHMLLAVSQIG